MSENKGWIKLYRSIKDCWIWELDPEESFNKATAWIDILLTCNHEDNKMMFDGKLITVKRGEWITSLSSLSTRWKWNRRKVSNFLNILESDGMISQDRNNRRTLIKVLKYDVFQGNEASQRTTDAQLLHNSCTTDAQLAHNSCTTDAQLLHTNKNDKNDKNEKNDKNDKNERSIGAKPHAPKFIKPTLEEVEDFIKEKGYSVNADSFWNYYESNGWKVGKNPMKNWKAAISQWNSRKDEKPKSEYMEAIKNRVNIVDSWV